MNEIFKKGLKHLRNNCIITGGHFRLFIDQNDLRVFLNKGTLESFRMAIELYGIAKEKGITADIGILINDLSSSCEECDCLNGDLAGFKRNNFIFPGQYNDILKSNGISPNVLNIYWEKHMRNRAKKELLKRMKVKDENIQNGSDGLFLLDPDGYGKIILTRKRDRDKYGAPACPLIMAGLNLEQDKHYESSINFYYIGIDNLENIPNYHAIEKGAKVSKSFSARIEVNNIYF
jgi:hypothetical protein